LIDFFFIEKYPLVAYFTMPFLVTI
jgi:hypothetical protein